MWVPRTPPEIILDHVQREQLEALTRASSASQAEVLRARIILLAALNRTNEEIADELQTTEQTVCKWRRRFARQGLAGLQDAARVGRPGRVLDSALNTVLTKVTQPPKGRARWSCRSMAQQAGVSKSWVQQLWFRNDLKPHQTRTFKLSNDEQFEQKFWDIVGLYLSPPQQAVVLCCDEKSQCQALERSQPGCPWARGM
jgi:transposase